MATLGNTAPRDPNQVPALLGTSSSDGKTVTIYANPVTHRLLVDSGGSGSSLSVTDGLTTVTGVTTLDFTSGATVTDGGGGTADVAISGSGTGTVTSVSVVSANGLAGTVATATTTPAITLTTSINSPLLAGNGTAISAATTTGSGSTAVLQTSPTLITPILGVAAATSINKLTITAPGSSAVLTIADGKTLTQSNTLTYTGTDGSTVAFGTGGTVLYSASTIPLTVGTTTIASGTNTRILYDNSGVLGEYTLTGSGTVVMMQTAPTFATSMTGPLLIGGSGTTGTQLTLKTTTGNGTTDALAIVGGNNGGTTFATFTTGALTIGTSGVFTTGTIELGAASDTTLARFSAGQLSVEGVQVDTASNSITLTNKTLTAPIMTTVAETGVGTADLLAPNNHPITVTSNAGSASQSFLVNTFTNSSAATMAITIPLATPTPKDGQFLVVRIYDFSGVAQTIGWTNTENSTVSVPTTSNGSTTLPLSVCFMYNAATTKWRCVATA